jgi:antirestriction protein ArdC
MFRDAARARSDASRTSLYDEITTKIIAELEARRVPWVQPWGTAAAKAQLAMPKNAATGRTYSGINVLILWGSVIEHGFPVQAWLTFRQALSLGGNVRKGAAAASLFRTDQLAPHRAPRAWSRQRRSAPAQSRSLGFLRLQKVRV